jgi:hypothetical protein
MNDSHECLCEFPIIPKGMFRFCRLGTFQLKCSLNLMFTFQVLLKTRTRQCYKLITLPGLVSSELKTLI